MSSPTMSFPTVTSHSEHSDHSDLAVLSGHSADEMAEVQLILTQPSSSVLYGHDA